MQLVLTRLSALSGPTGTFGRLAIDGVDFCVTCEQPWKNNKQGHSCIPAGDWELPPYDAAAHGPTVVFHNPALTIWSTPKLIPVDKQGLSLCEIHNGWP